MANIWLSSPPSQLTLRMSTTIHQQLPPPPVTDSANVAHGSIGVVIAVLALVLILCAVAVVIGQLCSGRSIMGLGHYDMESWVEAKCSSCVDGRILVFPPVTRSDGGEGSLAPASAADTDSTGGRQAEHRNGGS